MFKRWLKQMSCGVLPGFLLAQSCTHISSLSLSDSMAKGNPVEASDSFTEFLFFGYDNEIPHKVMAALMEKCSGKVTGVSTVHEVSWYFLASVTRVIAKGHCIGAKNPT